jgi:hypothetical protein
VTSVDLLGHRVRPLLVAGAFLVLGAAVLLVVGAGAAWWVLPLGVLGPDLTFLAAGGQQAEAPGHMPRRAVPFYNAAHHFPVAGGLTIAAAVLAGPTATALGLAWLSHLVWDRAVGYTLRDADGAMPHQRDGALTRA